MLPQIELQPGFSIPCLIHGTWHLHESARTLERAAVIADMLQTFDLGFTAIESADTYEGVEEVLGLLRAELQNSRGAEAAARLRSHTRVSQIGTTTLTPSGVRASIDRSRRRLRQERLDLVQLQWWNMAQPGWLEAGLELAKLRQEGAVTAIGVTNFPTVQMQALLAAGVPVVSNQVQVSLVDPRAQATLRAECEAAGVRLLGYGPLAGGFLSERWLAKPDPGLKPSAELHFGLVYRMLIDRFGGWPWFQELLQVLATRAAAHDVNLSTMALAWTLNRSGTSGLLVGIGSARRAHSYLEALRIRIDAYDEAAIGAVLTRRTPITGDVADIERAQLINAIATESAWPATA